MLTWVLTVVVIGIIPTTASLNGTKYQSRVECMKVVEAARDADIHARTKTDQMEFRAVCSPMAK